MNEFWVCDGCKSLVKANVARCYRCHAPRPADAREIETGVSGAVVTPGIDNGLQDVAFLLAEGKRIVPTGLLAAATISGVAVVLLMTLAQIALQLYVGVTFVTQGSSPLRNATLVSVNSWVAVVLAIAFVISLVLWLVFQAVSMYNAPMLGAGNSRNSIPGALAWWFVPVLNIWIPARIVADLHSRLGRKGSGGQLMVGIWWACFVLSSFFGPILAVILSVSAVGFTVAGAFGVSAGLAPSVAGITMGSTLLGVIQSALDVVSGVAFSMVILELHRRQQDRGRWLAEGRARFEAVAAASIGAGLGPDGGFGADGGPVPGGSPAIG